MNANEILTDNFEVKNNSFLYFLRDKSMFNKEAFRALCEAVRAVADENIEISRNAQKINFVYAQILKCFLYHFDKADKYHIENLPENYNKVIDFLDKSVEYYFTTRI
jgi:hypothetical protein